MSFSAPCEKCGARSENSGEATPMCGKDGCPQRSKIIDGLFLRSSFVCTCPQVCKENGVHVIGCMEGERASREWIL